MEKSNNKVSFKKPSLPAIAVAVAEGMVKDTGHKWYVNFMKNLAES